MTNSPSADDEPRTLPPNEQHEWQAKAIVAGWIPPWQLADRFLCWLNHPRTDDAGYCRSCGETTGQPVIPARNEATR